MAEEFTLVGKLWWLVVAVIVIGGITTTLEVVGYIHRTNHPFLLWAVAVLGSLVVAYMVGLHKVRVQRDTATEERETAITERDEAREQARAIPQTITHEHIVKHEWSSAMVIPAGVPTATGPTPVVSQPPETPPLPTRRVREAFRVQLEKHDEVQRQDEILKKLWRAYVEQYPTAPIGIKLGTDPLPTRWVEMRLKEMGQTWRRDEYRVSPEGS
jgi:hypothetical protein